jgi:hypothetical protein
LTKGRVALILLIPVEILLLYWLGTTLYEYPHRILTYRNHEIQGWIWRTVPVRVDGSWRFLEANGALTCQWELEVNNYSTSDTVRLSEVIYILRDRHGTEIASETQSVKRGSGHSAVPSRPYSEIGPGQTLTVHHLFPLLWDKAIRVAHADVKLAADIQPD